MVYNGKLDFNYRYSESDIINNGMLTSIGEMFRSYSIDTRDTRLDPPGCSEFQNMNYRISTNFQIIYLRVIFRSGDICKDLDTSFPKWEKIKNEYLENL